MKYARRWRSAVGSLRDLRIRGRLHFDRTTCARTRPPGEDRGGGVRVHRRRAARESASCGKAASRAASTPVLGKARRVPRDLSHLRATVDHSDRLDRPPSRRLSALSARPRRARSFAVRADPPVRRARSSAAFAHPCVAHIRSAPRSGRDRSSISPAHETRSASTRRPSASTHCVNSRTSASVITCTAASPATSPSAPARPRRVSRS